MTNLNEIRIRKEFEANDEFKINFVTGGGDRVIEWVMNSENKLL